MAISEPKKLPERVDDTQLAGAPLLAGIARGADVEIRNAKAKPPRLAKPASHGAPQTSR
jgi:hypothetical protein